MNIEKVKKKLPAGYAADVEGMDVDRLQSEIIKAETALRECEMEMEADEKLTAAKLIVKDMVGGYNDVRKAQRAKIAYVLHLLEEKGAV